MRSGIHGVMTCLFGLFAACGDPEERPDVPVVTLSAVAATVTGEVTIAFRLSDLESRLVNVALRVGTTTAAMTPATGAPSSPSLRGLESSATGVAHTFIWNTTADLGFGRSPQVFLAASALAGPVTGIGDQIGPFAVDNTSLPQAYRVSGDVCLAGSPLGTPGSSTAGKLYVGLFDEALGYPPMGQPTTSADLGSHDVAAACVSYSFFPVEPGNYRVIAILDHNNNNFALASGFSVDEGDIFNAGGTTLQVSDQDVAQGVSLNYYCTPPLCPPT